MPVEVKVVREEEKGRPARLQNTFQGRVDTEEVSTSIEQSNHLLTELGGKRDVVAIFEPGANLLGATGVLFDRELMSSFINHPNLAEILAVELKLGIGNSFLKVLIGASRMNVPVTMLKTIADLEKLLDAKYDSGVAKPANT